MFTTGRLLYQLVPAFLCPLSHCACNLSTEEAAEFRHARHEQSLFLEGRLIGVEVLISSGRKLGLLSPCHLFKLIMRGRCLFSPAGDYSLCCSRFERDAEPLARRGRRTQLPGRVLCERCELSQARSVPAWAPPSPGVLAPRECRAGGGDEEECGAQTQAPEDEGQARWGWRPIGPQE